MQSYPHKTAGQMHKTSSYPHKMATQTHKTSSYPHKTAIQTHKTSPQSHTMLKFPYTLIFPPRSPSRLRLKVQYFAYIIQKRRFFSDMAWDKLYSTKLFDMLKLVLKIPIIVCAVKEGSTCSNKYKLSLKI